MDGEWSLEDLYILPRTYIDAYSFMYSFLRPIETFDDLDDRLVITYSAHPWKGGFSSLNFYQNLKYIVPAKERPSVITIQYASPGWIELGVILVVATQIKRIVSCFVGSASELNSLYKEIYEGMHERKMMKLEAKRESLKLSKEQLDFAVKSTDKLSRLMGFENIKQINRLTKNPLATLKILLSFYRKIKILAEFDESGKTKL
ncbi:hypothetical protein G0Q06_04270 [Puniceicoccales bacterium CK1056]|uniref:Uncharacterized protein n=1 Tax=Oceanipulchritudo coccoides TaxID=2706888 RepID=A0A6B2M025_9BACT|nr:hypothetical protein [Oceanipulchritudo coccoides]NDV61659.1 hypothetical protein [Oceanipulchritudo coccoides]